MSRTDHSEGRVVAELGRPETPDETAARKAANSREHRERQTVTNLIYALIVTVACVLVIIMIAPNPTPTPAKPIDYRSVAAQGAGSEPDPLAAPKLPSGYHANSAQLDQDTASGVDSWNIGLITPSNQYIAIVQGFHGNPTWAASELKEVKATGKTTVDGVRWTVYDARKTGNGSGNVQYALESASGDSTYLVYGTASAHEFTTVARALTPAIRADRTQEKG